MSLSIVKRKKSIIILAWLAPIIAIIISANLLYKNYTQSGNEITIIFKDINGLDLRQSNIKYNGIDIGELSSIALDKNNISNFIVKANIYKEYNYLVKEGSVFWLVSPKISLEGIESIGNILTGNYIEIKLASNDVKELKKLKKETIFTGYLDKPLQDGIRITLNTSSGDYGLNSSIMYKGFKVGKVLDKVFINKDQVHYEIIIYKKYENLISSNTKFYKIKPLDVKASIKEFKLDVKSLKNIISSNIAFYTKNEDGLIKKEYNLFDSKEDIFYANEKIKLYSSSNIKIDNVYFKDDKIAKVISQTYDIKSKKTIYTIKVKESYMSLLQYRVNFFIKEPEISLLDLDIKNILEPAKIYLNVNTKKKSNIQSKYNIDDNYLSKKRFLFKIKSNDITKNDLIFYKGRSIGKIESIKLSKDINIASAYIDLEYKNLINNSTFFYKIKILNSSIGANGLDVDISSLNEILFGGITFETPRKTKLTKKTFKLYANKNDMINQDTFNIKVISDNKLNIKITSKLFYKDIEIGSINDIILNNNEQIEININIRNKYKKLFGKKSKIYLKDTQISLEKIQNISSAILGANLYLISNKNNGFKRTHMIDSINPSDIHYKNGLRVKVRALTAKDIDIATPIYYKNVEIGKVENVVLLSNGRFVVCDLFIESQYANLIKKNTVFKRLSAVDVSVGVLSANIKMGSMKTLLKGGLQVELSSKKSQNAKNNDTFILDE